MIGTECHSCAGFGYRVTGWVRDCDGWGVQSTEPCRVCSCFDCGTSTGVYEVATREGRPEVLCVDCFVESGDDNERSCRAHDEERR